MTVNCFSLIQGVDPVTFAVESWKRTCCIWHGKNTDRNHHQHTPYISTREISPVLHFISPYKRYSIELSIFHLNTLAYYPQVGNRQGDVQFPEIHSVQSQAAEV
jgi:hypothetical protein